MPQILRQMTRALSIFLGLLGLAVLKCLGDNLSRWLSVSIPGSFWGFLLLLLMLCFVKQAPKAMADASAFLLNHLTLFLLPSLVAAAVGLRFVAEAAGLLVVSGLLVTVLMAVGCGWVISAWPARQGNGHGA